MPSAFEPAHPPACMTICKQRVLAGQPTAGRPMCMRPRYAWAQLNTLLINPLPSAMLARRSCGRQASPWCPCHSSTSGRRCAAGSGGSRALLTQIIATAQCSTLQTSVIMLLHAAIH